jgi:hypothetical protein
MEDNPYAFPQSSPLDGRGMTLRDWFSGQALAGLLANEVAFGAALQGNPSAIAHVCLEYADAMLEARLSTKEKES